MQVNNSEREPEDNKALESTREGQPGVGKYLKIDNTTVDGEKIKMPISTLNDYKSIFIFREAKDKITKEGERAALAEMEPISDPIAKAEVAKAAVERSKKEVEEIPQYSNFLEENKNQIQLIDTDRDVAYQDGSGRVLDCSEYFELKGIPTDAENYFLTSLNDVGGFNDLERYGLTVEYVYTNSSGTTGVRPIGLKASEKGKTKMVFLFAQAENIDKVAPNESAQYDKAVNS